MRSPSQIAMKAPILGRPGEPFIRPFTFKLITLLLLILLPAVHAHDKHRVPAQLTLSPGDYELDLTFDVPAIMLSRTLNHLDPQESAGALLDLTPEQRDAALAQAERFFRINVRLEIDGQRQDSEIELPSFEPGPLGRLGDPGAEFHVRITGALPDNASALRLHAGRSLGIIELEVIDANGVPLHQEILQGGIGSEVIPLWTMNATHSPSPEPLRMGDVLPAFFLIGASRTLSYSPDPFLYVLGILLLSLAWRSVLSQFAAFAIGSALTLYLGSSGDLIVPVSVVAPVSAICLALISTENLLVDRMLPLRPTALFVSGLFPGLLLSDAFLRVGSAAGLSGSDLPLAMTGFATGMLAVLALVISIGWALLQGLRRRVFTSPGAFRRITRPLSLALGLVGAILCGLRLLPL